MIVEMKHLTILCTEASRKETVDSLQELGVLHLSNTMSPINQTTLDFTSAEADFNAAQKALSIVKAIKKNTTFNGTVTPETILDAANKISEIEEAISTLEHEISQYSPFGDFDPTSATKLADEGLPVTLFKVHGAIPAVANGGFIKILFEDASEGLVYGVAIGSLEEGHRAEIISMPSRPLSETKSLLKQEKEKLRAAKADLESYAGSDKQLTEIISTRKVIRDFYAAEAAMGADAGIAWITGFCPAEKLEKVEAAAKIHGWGIASREPYADELPPTLLRPPRIFRPITALFDMLGIAPSYYEADVSIVFYAFFTIFFAMLVGDAGYGAIIAVMTILARLKFKNANSAPFILLGVFSSATILWGVLSATYFGIPKEMIPAWLKFPISEWIGNNSNIMQFCFFLGSLHLTVARLWNAVKLWPDSKALAEIGWTGVVWTMYCVSCLVGVNGFVFPSFMWVVSPVSILLIFLFMLKRSELKTDGVTLGILPLNIMSCLGDIISYVRLFAVGLASVMVAENFNQMAIDLSLPLAVKIPAVILILFLGHAMNFAMGALSILVHAVRLNTLEFSNHKGISWSGFAYEPFRK